MPRINKLVGVAFALFGFLLLFPVLGGGGGLRVMADEGHISALKRYSVAEAASGHRPEVPRGIVVGQQDRKRKINIRKGNLSMEKGVGGRGMTGVSAPSAGPKWKLGCNRLWFKGRDGRWVCSGSQGD